MFFFFKLFLFLIFIINRNLHPELKVINEISDLNAGWQPNLSYYLSIASHWHVVVAKVQLQRGDHLCNRNWLGSRWPIPAGWLAATTCFGEEESIVNHNRSVTLGKYKTKAK